MTIPFLSSQVCSTLSWQHRNSKFTSTSSMSYKSKALRRLLKVPHNLTLLYSDLFDMELWFSVRVLRISEFLRIETGVFSKNIMARLGNIIIRNLKPCASRRITNQNKVVFQTRKRFWQCHGKNSSPLIEESLKNRFIRTLFMKNKTADIISTLNSFKNYSQLSIIKIQSNPVFQLKV